MEKSRKKQLVKSFRERPMDGGVFFIENSQTGQKLLLCETNLTGSQNRFAFSQQTGSCLYHQLAKDWKAYGPNAFTFHVLEKITQKETQTSEEFLEDLKVLKQLWSEKLAGESLY